MSSKISSAKLTGNPDESGWVQVYEFKPDDRDKYKLRGQLFAVISTSIPREGIDSILAGREVLLRLHEEYYGKMEGSAFERLKSAVQRVLDEFSSWEDVEIAAVSFVSDVVYLTAGGGSAVSVLRGGNLSRIVSSSKSEINIASGKLWEGDVVVAGTGKFHSRFSEGVLTAVLSKGDISESIEELAPAVHAQETTGNLGAIFIRVESEATAYVINQESEQKIVVNEPINTFPEQPPSLATGQDRFYKSASRLGGLASILRKPKIYVKDRSTNEESARKKRVSATVGVFLLLILLVSIFFGIKQKQAKDKKESLDATLTSAKHELEEAQQLFSLNPERSRELVNSARGKVLSLSDEGLESEDVDKMKNTIKQSQKDILGEYDVEAKLFVDLSLLSSNFKGTDISFSDDHVYVADRQDKKIVFITAETKRSEVVAGPGVIDQIGGITAYAGKVYVINKEGLFEVNQGREKKIDSEWMGDVLPFAYAGNMYILDKNASTIWRYSGAEGNFAERKDWLAQGTNYDLTDATQMLIDGSIWVLSGSGEIYKFEAGNRLNFSLGEIYPQLNSVKAFYTDEELDDMYLLDPSNKRVVVVDKDGKYVAQYISDSFDNAINLVVSRKEKMMIVLTGEELLSVDLEHLK